VVYSEMVVNNKEVTSSSEVTNDNETITVTNNDKSYN
jgi:hypothetical protein